MVVHQIHEYGGAWEDAYDRIVATYFDEQKATEDMEKRRAKMKLQEDFARRCSHCPVLNMESANELTDDLNKSIKSYCPRFEPETDLNGLFECRNYYELWESSSYKIRTEEVLDG